MAPNMASAVHAVEANLFAFFQQLKAWPRVTVHDDGACIFTISDLPYPLFNSVLRARVDDVALDGLIEARMQSCRDRRVPMLWWTGPSTAPPHLGERLRGAAKSIRGGAKNQDGGAKSKASKPARGAAKKTTTPRKAGGS